MYISYGSTDPSIVRYFSNRVPRSLSTTSGQFVIDSATVAAWSLTSPSSSRPAKVKFPAQGSPPASVHFCCLRAFTTSHLQVIGEDTKITNSGTGPSGFSVAIDARLLRPSASENFDASLARRSSRIQPRSR